MRRRRGAGPWVLALALALMGVLQVHAMCPPESGGYSMGGGVTMDLDGCVLSSVSITGTNNVIIAKRLNVTCDFLMAPGSSLNLTSPQGANLSMELRIGGSFEMSGAVLTFSNLELYSRRYIYIGPDSAVLGNGTGFPGGNGYGMHSAYCRWQTIGYTQFGCAGDYGARGGAHVGPGGCGINNNLADNTYDNIGSLGPHQPGCGGGAVYREGEDSNGGAGGGSIFLHAPNITILSGINANGLTGFGPNGGGGGAGGAIVMLANKLKIANVYLLANGADSGGATSECEQSGGGGGGAVKKFSVSSDDSSIASVNGGYGYNSGGGGDFGPMVITQFPAPDAPVCASSSTAGTYIISTDSTTGMTTSPSTTSSTGSSSGATTNAAGGSSPSSSSSPTSTTGTGSGTGATTSTTNAGTTVTGSGSDSASGANTATAPSGAPTTAPPASSDVSGVAADNDLPIGAIAGGAGGGLVLIIVIIVVAVVLSRRRRKPRAASNPDDDERRVDESTKKVNLTNSVALESVGSASPDSGTPLQPRGARGETTSTTNGLDSYNPEAKIRVTLAPIAERQPTARSSQMINGDDSSLSSAQTVIDASDEEAVRRSMQSVQPPPGPVANESTVKASLQSLSANHASIAPGGMQSMNYGNMQSTNNVNNFQSSSTTTSYAMPAGLASQSDWGSVRSDMGPLADRSYAQPYNTGLGTMGAMGYDPMLNSLGPGAESTVRSTLGSMQVTPMGNPRAGGETTMRANALVRVEVDPMAQMQSMSSNEVTMRSSALNPGPEDALQSMSGKEVTMRASALNPPEPESPSRAAIDPASNEVTMRSTPLRRQESTTSRPAAPVVPIDPASTEKTTRATLSRQNSNATMGVQPLSRQASAATLVPAPAPVDPDSMEVTRRNAPLRRAESSAQLPPTAAPVPAPAVEADPAASEKTMRTPLRRADSSLSNLRASPAASFSMGANTAAAPTAAPPQPPVASEDTAGSEVTMRATPLRRQESVTQRPSPATATNPAPAPAEPTVEKTMRGGLRASVSGSSALGSVQFSDTGSGAAADDERTMRSAL